MATPLPPAAAAVLAAGAKIESDSFLYAPSLLAARWPRSTIPEMRRRSPLRELEALTDEDLGPAAISNCIACLAII